MTATITTTELATELATDPRTLRKFLRSDQGPGKVGKGARYALPANARAIATMRKKFIKWEESLAKPETDTTPESD